MIKKRVCDITLETSSGFKTISGLDISFNIKKLMGGGMNEAKIEVSGLSTSDIHYLTTSISSMFKPQSRKPYVSLSAGYSDNYGTIFSGNAWYSVPSQRPNRTLTMTCYSGGEQRLQGVSVSIRDATIHSAIDNIAKQVSLDTNVQIPNVKIGNISYVGDVQGYFRLLEGFGDYQIYIDDNKIVAIEGRTYKGTGVQVIDADSGLIGIPEPTDYGVNIKYRLNAYAQPGGILQLKSQLIPMVNGDYQILTVEHVGQSRGDSWYTLAECKKV